MKNEPAIRGLLYGDVIGSRRIKDRPSFSTKLNEAVATLSQSAGIKGEAIIQIQKGLDEIAGVAETPKVLLKTALYISRKLFPQQMRFVLLKGIIDTGLDGDDLSKMDGEVFHRTAAKLLELKAADMWMLCEAYDATTNMAVENQFNAIMMVKSRWTDSQMDLYEAYRRLQTQEKVAALKNITQQSVSKQLNAIRGNEMLRLEDQFENWINNLPE